MRLLNGSELAGFIKARQARQVRSLRQAQHIIPKLAIVQTFDSPVINKYVALKKRYGADIGVEVAAHFIPQAEALDLIQRLNQDSSVHGIIVQLPLPEPAQTQELVDAVLPQKDVDGLGQKAVLDPATPLAVVWLLAGYNIELKDKVIVIVGRGRLVGEPLAHMLRDSGCEVRMADRQTEDLGYLTRQADVIISATGSPRVLTSDMIRPNTVVVDAGVATEGGKLIGDVDEDVRQREDLTITPEKGGGGPLTVCALFENVIRAANESIPFPKQN